MAKRSHRGERWILDNDAIEADENREVSERASKK